MSRAQKNITAEDFVRPFPEEIRNLVYQLREMISAHFPEADEYVYSGWKLLGYKQKSGKKRVYFCFIYPSNDHVMLGLEYGVLVSDPRRILEGAGSQVRSIRLEPGNPVDSKTLLPYLHSALHVALLTREERMRRLLETDI